MVINEIAWAGTVANVNAEWLELCNAGDGLLDLAGWTLVSSDGQPNISLSGTIAAGGFYVLERTAESTVADLTADLLYTGALVDTGEVLILRDSQGLEHDRVDAWHSGDKALRASMERRDPLISGLEPSNWGTNDGTIMVGSDAAGNPIRGTPGHANSVASPEV